MLANSRLSADIKVDGDASRSLFATNAKFIVSVSLEGSSAKFTSQCFFNKECWKQESVALPPSAVIKLCSDEPRHRVGLLALSNDRVEMHMVHALPSCFIPLTYYNDRRSVAKR